MASDVVDLITEDHRRLGAMLEGLRDTAGREERLAEFVARLAAHHRAEEEEVYPVARDAGGGDEAVASGRRDHDAIEELLSGLLAVGAASPDFDRMAGRLADLVRTHLHEEERRVLPALRDALDERRRARLGEAYAARCRPLSAGHRPTVGEVDPTVLGVDAMDDATRMHAGGDETEQVEVSGSGLMPVDDEGDPVPPGGQEHRTDPDRDD